MFVVFFKFFSDEGIIAHGNDGAVVFFVDFDNHGYSFDFTGCLFPQAVHLRKANSPSRLISVSGLPQSGHKTNSWAYCFIFSLIRDAAILLPRKRLPCFMSPGAASSFWRYLSRCSGSRLSVFVIATKLLMMVLCPSRRPLTEGMVKRAFSRTDAGMCSRALFNRTSYSISSYLSQGL